MLQGTFNYCCNVLMHWIEGYPFSSTQYIQSAKTCSLKSFGKKVLLSRRKLMNHPVSEWERQWWPRNGAWWGQDRRSNRRGKWARGKGREGQGRERLLPSSVQRKKGVQLVMEWRRPLFGTSKEVKRLDKLNLCFAPLLRWYIRRFL